MITFEQYLRNTRNHFVSEIIKVSPDEGVEDVVLTRDQQIRLRVAAEDLLIAFDQLKERI